MHVSLLNDEAAFWSDCTPSRACSLLGWFGTLDFPRSRRCSPSSVGSWSASPRQRMMASVFHVLACHLCILFGELSLCSCHFWFYELLISLRGEAGRHSRFWWLLALNGSWKLRCLRMLGCGLKGCSSWYSHQCLFRFLTFHVHPRTQNLYSYANLFVFHNTGLQVWASSLPLPFFPIYSSCHFSPNYHSRQSLNNSYKFNFLFKCIITW